MNDKNYLYKSATELVDDLAKQKISSVELLEKTITRIEKLDSKINAIVIRDFESARVEAKKADEAIARGDLKPLLGLPITVKEAFAVSGLKKTWGNPVFKNNISDNDAIAVERLKAAGAIIIGLTNVPFMLKDWQSNNDIYGTTNNPYDLSLTPGGSSGGSAAALSAGFVALELGSDMGGSIRVPAHYCGVYGHRPTLNLIPLAGGSPPKSPVIPGPILNDFAVAGPMARSAADLELALKVLVGPEAAYDGKAYQLSLPKPRHTQLNDFNVLILDSHPLCPISKDVKNAIDGLSTWLKKIGVNVSTECNTLPDLVEIATTYVKLFSSYIAGNMPEKDYIHAETAAKALNADDDSFESCFLRGLVLSHRAWIALTELRRQLREQWREIYEDFDVVLFPVMPTVAFPHDHSPFNERNILIDGKEVPYSLQHVWPSVSSLFGLPATVAPIGCNQQGLPIGIQIIGDYLEDLTTIEFAKLLENELGGFIAPKLSE